MVDNSLVVDRKLIRDLLPIPGQISSSLKIPTYILASKSLLPCYSFDKPRLRWSLTHLTRSDATSIGSLGGSHRVVLT